MLCRKNSNWLRCLNLTPDLPVKVDLFIQIDLFRVEGRSMLCNIRHQVHLATELFSRISLQTKLIYTIIIIHSSSLSNWHIYICANIYHLVHFSSFSQKFQQAFTYYEKKVRPWLVISITCKISFQLYLLQWADYRDHNTYDIFLSSALV